MKPDSLRTAALAFVVVTSTWASGCGPSEGPERDAGSPREAVVECVPVGSGQCANLWCTNGTTSWWIITRFCDPPQPPPPPPPPPSPSERCRAFATWIPENLRCDDGNANNGDGCNMLCQIEANSACENRGSMCKQISLCGDGQPASDETCDDGNTRGDDGCSSDCQTIEPGWVCRIAGKPCAPRCGDGRLLGTEDCDDGNSESGDGCSRFCRKEPGAFCPQPGKLCEIAVCGSSGHDGGVCDAGSAIVPTCGDGIPSPDEECDQGSGNDDLAYGGCTSACVLGPHCGDGIVNGPAETCDRGADKPDIVSSYGKKDTCTATCLATPYCGDGVVDVMFGEECDLGDSKNGAPGSPCDLACHVILG